MKKKSYSMEVSVALMALIAAVLIIVSFFDMDQQLKVYGSPAFIVLMAAFAIAMIWCMFEKKITLRNLGFFVCHLGLLLFLVGVFLGVLFGNSYSVAKPIEDGRSVTFAELYGILGTDKLYNVETGETMDLGFGFTVTGFDIEYYDVVDDPNNPTYKIEDGSGNVVYRQKDAWGNFNFGVGPSGNEIIVNQDQLYNNGKWATNYVLNSGLIVRKTTMPPSIKRFVATVSITDGDKTIEKDLLVNHPVSHNGWRIYLMSYDQQSTQPEYIQLTVKKDPGIYPVLIGLWLLMAGTFILCFRKKGVKADV